MPSDDDTTPDPAAIIARAAALARALHDRPEAVKAVLAAIQAGPADTAAIVERAAPTPADEVLAALADLHAAGVIRLAPGGAP